MSKNMYIYIVYIYKYIYNQYELVLISAIHCRQPSPHLLTPSSCASSNSSRRRFLMSAKVACPSPVFTRLLAGDGEPNQAISVRPGGNIYGYIYMVNMDEYGVSQTVRQKINRKKSSEVSRCFNWL